jgi:hypothetical protein
MVLIMINERASDVYAIDRLGKQISDGHGESCLIPTDWCESG